MEIRELEKIAVWYSDHFDRFAPLYQGVISPIQQNANQPQKVPVEEQLNELQRYLRRMDFDTLSIHQIDFLDDLSVGPLIGIQGADFVDSIVRTANYDASTAAAQLNEAFGKMSNVRTYLGSLLQTLESLGLRNEEQENEFITVRVCFQNDVSINNVSEWKKTSADWFDIIRGLAMANNEAPEATKIVGATTGSIILILATTAGVTALLARICKQLTTVAKDVLELAHTAEDLKQKKMLTEVMDIELKRLATEKKANVVKEILEDFKATIGEGAGDKVTALKKSVEKLLAFNEKGGAVDFVMPEDKEEDTEAEEAISPTTSSITVARQAIREYQEVREQVKLLSYQKPANDSD